ncbi:MAG: ORF6N domain-containing protein [Bacteroidia bacterium]|nr:ORF6N domain-containing protein [Bacteroidia bacterium]
MEANKNTKQDKDAVAKNETSVVVPQEILMNKIYFLRGLKVMLDSDLSELYKVETKQLKRQVNRNIDRFPSDFMFQLTKLEFDDLRSQFGTSNWGGTRYLPMAFTEQGVAMLSSVLSSKQAIQVNIEIMRVFSKIRQALFDNTELRLLMEEIRKKTDNNTKNIEVVFQYLDELTEKNIRAKPRKTIGFKTSKSKNKKR